MLIQHKMAQLWKKMEKNPKPTHTHTHTPWSNVALQWKLHFTNAWQLFEADQIFTDKTFWSFIPFLCESTLEKLLLQDEMKESFSELKTNSYKTENKR